MTESGYYLNMAGGANLIEQPRNALEVLRAGVRTLRDRLPDGWTLAAPTDPGLSGPPADAVLTLGAPDGLKVSYVVTVKLVLESREVAGIRDQLRQDRPDLGGMVIARYLSSNVRQRLADAGISYVDVTGNILVRSARPGLHLGDRGADADPWRGPGRPRLSLGGKPAAQVVRWLVDRPGPWRVTEIVDFSRTSTGSVYRVLEYLQDEGLIVRDGDGRVDVPDWAALLRRWSQDYGYLRTNRVTRWIAPRGVPAFLEQVRASEEREYAVTGTVAASAWAPYAPARSAMVYVADIDRAARAWGLREVESGVNVLLAEPAYEVAFERTTDIGGGLIAAAPSQVVVDLMTGPGRAPAEAEELLDWMQRNERSWRG